MSEFTTMDAQDQDYLRSVGALNNGPPSDASDHEAKMTKLTQLSALDYDKCREAEAKVIGIRVSALD